MPYVRFACTGLGDHGATVGVPAQDDRLACRAHRFGDRGGVGVHDDERVGGADPGGEVRAGDRGIGEIDDVDVHVVALLGLADEPVGDDRTEPAFPDTGNDHRQRERG